MFALNYGHMSVTRKCLTLRPNLCFASGRSTINVLFHLMKNIIWAAPSEFGTYRLCEQRRFRPACASALSRQNLRCSLIQAVSQEEPSDRKPDPWLLWMAGHAQLKFVLTECSKTQIRLTGLNSCFAAPMASDFIYQEKQWLKKLYIWKLS